MAYNLPLNNVIKMFFPQLRVVFVVVISENLISLLEFSPLSGSCLCYVILRGLQTQFARGDGEMADKSVH